MRRVLQDQLRRRGFFDAGQLQDVSQDTGNVNTAARDHARDGIHLTPSDSTSEGNDNLFLVGAENNLPASAGLWAYIV